MAGLLQYLENGQNKIHRLYSSAFGASSDSAEMKYESEVFNSRASVWSFICSKFSLVLPIATHFDIDVSSKRSVPQVS